MPSFSLRIYGTSLSFSCSLSLSLPLSLLTLVSSALEKSSWKVKYVQDMWVVSLPQEIFSQRIQIYFRISYIRALKMGLVAVPEIRTGQDINIVKESTLVKGLKAPTLYGGWDLNKIFRKNHFSS